VLSVSHSKRLGSFSGISSEQVDAHALHINGQQASALNDIDHGSPALFWHQSQIFSMDWMLPVTLEEWPSITRRAVLLLSVTVLRMATAVT
jgi:hypothetical protein